MRIAALDLGSNSFHLLVVEARADGSFEPLVREKEMLRLADVVSREGRITERAAEDAVSAVRRLKALAEAAGAEEIVAKGTSALREADNSSELVDRLDARTGVHVDVISGQEEARLIFAAVRASVLLEPGPAVCLDLGGGSLEIMVGDQRGMRWATSSKLGVARLTTELVQHDPLEPEDVRRLRRRVGSVLAPIASEVARYRPQMLVGTSGTLCDLARMAAARSGAVPESVNQLTVTKQDLAAVHARLLALPSAARAKLAGLEVKRADIVPAGSVVLMVAMELFGLDTLTVGEWALREGIVIDAIGHHDPAEWREDAHAIRRSSVAGLARRCGADVGHGRQVARLAIEIFDATTSLHHLGDDDRELLEHAAVLHDIGEHVSVDAHHKHTAYLIQNGRLRGFSPQEVNVLACLGRFHRRGDPKPSFEPYAALDPDARTRVDQLSAILRLADGLDRSHSGAVHTLHVNVDRRREVVTLAIEAEGDAELELWGVRRKRDLFEQVFGCRLEVSVAEEPQAEAAPA